MLLTSKLKCKVKYNNKTKNWNSLILYTTHLLAHCPFEKSTATAIFLLRVVTQNFIQTLSANELLEQLKTPSNFAEKHVFYTSGTSNFPFFLVF